jgi:hypothetical protein
MSNALASLTSSDAAVQQVVGDAKAFGNSEGFEGVKFPKPSFKRMATGWFVHAVVTTTSGKLSPFTSTEAIWRPPAGAVMPTIRPTPALK